ncbi:hypothetical protein BV006_01508 [Haemophilus influenzae]|nr:hypothetical protein BVZ70_00798 [Haemophilus influenzae]PRI87163.1 hypothetical protein BV020_00647 [Haemophilus influenzae]PRI90064.1 hypothetical protein BV021_00340 [Haemophilus influenzae]PRJ52945.1 hypothetical protein BV094_01508 [Haemophilus influenzae]PRJ57088.1 hypothetical protein BV097_00551 [Haemophilus influenzae]
MFVCLLMKHITYFLFIYTTYMLYGFLNDQIFPNPIVLLSVHLLLIKIYLTKNDEIVISIPIILKKHNI